MPKPLLTSQNYSRQRDVVAAEIMPRGSKNWPGADYFQSKQTGLLGVCWSGARRWEGGLERSWRHSSASAKVFLRIKAMKLDSGKTVLTSFVWSAVAVIHGCFLAWRQRVLEGVTLTPQWRQMGSSWKSYIKFNKEPKYRFLIKNKVITDKFNPTPTITEFKQQFTVMDRFS